MDVQILMSQKQGCFTFIPTHVSQFERVKYLYLTVPTDIELNRQVAELQFLDKYAIKRSRKQYQDMLSPHFTFISSRLLESRFYFDEESTSFTDLLYRY